MNAIFNAPVLRYLIRLRSLDNLLPVIPSTSYDRHSIARCRCGGRARLLVLDLTDCGGPEMHPVVECTRCERFLCRCRLWVVEDPSPRLTALQLIGRWNQLVPGTTSRLDDSARRAVPIGNSTRTNARKRKFGTLKGQIKIIDPDWWRTMTDEEVEAFVEGRY